MDTPDSSVFKFIQSPHGELEIITTCKPEPGIRVKTVGTHPADTLQGFVALEDLIDTPENEQYRVDLRGRFENWTNVSLPLQGVNAAFEKFRDMGLLRL